MRQLLAFLTVLLVGCALEVSSKSVQVQGLVVQGPSSRGKSTPLRLIAGLERQQSGAQPLHEAVLSSGSTFVQPEQRLIGMVFQDLAQFPQQTMECNVGFGLLRTSKAEHTTDPIPS